MIDYYLEMRSLHIVAVIASGSLFLVRGSAIFAGALWPRSAPLRYLSQAIDTLLLIAGIILTTIIDQYPFAQGWLTVKVLLLVVYITLGILAFREGRPRPVRMGLWVSALLVYLFIISVAVTHHPLGVFSGLL